MSFTIAVDIDEEDELADEYDIASIPCLVVFKNGEETDRSILSIAGIVFEAKKQSPKDLKLRKMLK